jgi:hypothetical protein
MCPEVASLVAYLASSEAGFGTVAMTFAAAEFVSLVLRTHNPVN